VPELGKAYIQVIPTTKGIKGELESQMGDAGESAGKKSGARIGSAIKSAILAVGIGEAIKSAVTAGADLQQSFGGLDTIYGEAADAAKRYAAEAAAAGISANDYAEQAVSFGASLKQAFGGDTVKAAEAANIAILDMADNAAKMGTDISSIQNAYQGFAKGNYTMLDNLKLGYGGTRSEMERLLKNAQEISGVEYDIDNLGDVYDAIHVIQGELGLTGVAADEAATTFSGSLGAMKAAAANVLGNLALGEDIGPSLEVLGQTVSTFLSANLFPMVSNIVSTLPSALAGLITTLAPQLIPAGVELLVNLMHGLAETVPDLLIQVAAMIPDIVSTLLDNLPALVEGAVNLFVGIIQAIPIILPDLIRAIIGMIPKIVQTLIRATPQIFKGALQMLGGLLQAIPNVLKGAVMGLWDIGRNLVMGLWNGISDVTGWILDKIRGFGASILSGIKGIFGIHSPSKEMEWMGQMLDQGLARGITGGVGVVDDAMGELGARTMNGFDPTINASVGTGGGAVTNMGGININVYGKDGQNARDIAEAVMAEIQAAVDRRGAVFA
jgi:phage-related protein